MFASLFRAADASDRSPWGDFWFEPVTAMTGAGVHVSADNAMRITAVYRCVRLLAETMACIPFHLKSEDANGNHKDEKGHWLYKLIAKRPNDYQNAFEWHEMMMAHVAVRGNGYNRIISNARGQITDLIPIMPDAIKREDIDGGGYRYKIRNAKGDETTVPRGEVFVVRGLSWNGRSGLNPIEYARESLGTTLAAQQYGSKFFANSGMPIAGWVEKVGGFKDANAKQVYRESLQLGMTGKNAGKIAVFDNGDKYHDPPQVSLADMQFLETRKFGVTEVCRIFGCPPHLVYDLDRSTNNNIEQQSIEFMVFTMAQWATRWAAAVTSQLLDDDALTVEYDARALERADMKTRGEFYGKGIMDGWLTRNEARAMENRNPIDDLDEPLLPLNMIAVGEDRAPSAAPATNTTKQPPAPAEPADQASAQTAQQKQQQRRLQALVDSNAKRIAKRIYKAGVYDDETAVLVSDALAVPFESARAWCETARATEQNEQSVLQALLSLSGHLPERAAQPATPILFQPRFEISSPVHVAPPSVNFDMPVHIDAHIEANRPVTKIVKAVRDQDGNLTAEVHEQ
jgi:HK97 family phage portal protein